MNVAVHKTEGKCRLQVVGVLDAAGSTRLREAALEALQAGCVRQTVDLTGTEKVDGPALSVLVTLRFKLQDAGGSLHLEGLSGEVEQAFVNTGLARVFELGNKPS